MSKITLRFLLSPAQLGTVVLAFVLLDVVEAEGEDLEDNLKEDFRPVVLLVVSRRR